MKKVERDFLKLLRNIIGDENRVPSHHSAYPLSQVPVHHRQFTISGVVNVEEILNSDFDQDNLQIGVDAIELRVRCEANLGDPNDSAGEAQLERIAEAFAKLRRSTIVPIILTALQVDSSSGSRRKSQLHLMSYCFRLGPEYCTIDLKLDQSDLETLVAARGHTNIIGTYNLPERSPDGWNDPKLLSLYEGAASLGCHIVKITMPADSINDNFPVHSFQQKVEALRRDVRLIAYNSGKKGRPSLCFNTCLTPVKSRKDDQTDNGFDHDDVLVTAHEIFTALFSAFIYEPTEFFIYGANVSYSLSPAMHNTAYRALGMPHTYRAHSSSTLDDFRRLSREESFGGAAIVQPYKTVVIALLKGLSSHAKAIGSVNTIVPVRELADDGSIPDELRLFSQLNRRGPVKALYGHNTDWIGIRACLRRGLSPANTVRPQSSALVCGAGGMARSAIYSMLSLGVRNVFICNRTVANAQKLANHYNKLIDDIGISELDPSNAAHTRVRILDTFDTPWPKDYRHPTLIVSSIPTQSADGSPTNFVLPDDWLRSPTGGVVVEVSRKAMPCKWTDADDA